MDDKVKVKVQPLDSEAFKAYGQVLDSKQPVFPDVDAREGRVAMEMLRVKRAGNWRNLEQMAVHFSYNQTFIPLSGTMVLIVAPPPQNRDARPEDYALDYEKLAAFAIEPGQAALIDHGVWHSLVVRGDEARFINVTRKDPGEGTSSIEDIQDGRPNRRKYVEFVNFKRRDGRAIELEF
jgi:ureidoglycolate hydrolase